MIFYPESETIEYKTCFKELGKSVWETYSSFANTSGGILYLGVKEVNRDFTAIGVENAERMIDEFWNTINNPTKVSKNILSNRSVEIINEDDKKIIKVTIPEAKIEDKPIYLNKNPKESYIRYGTMDKQITEIQLESFYRNRKYDADSLLLDNYGVEDLCITSIRKFQSLYAERIQDESVLSMDIESFLLSIGALVVDRNDGRKKKITLASLLFFGTAEAITSYLPRFNLDYLYYLPNTERWADRVVFDGIDNLNIFNFYSKVYNKIQDTLRERFILKNDSIRVSSKPLLRAFREALINTLSHADYQHPDYYPKIENTDKYIRFSNPGGLRVSREEFINGGISNPRNVIIAKFFGLLGLSEKAGTGGRTIFTIPSDIVKKPELNNYLTRTELTIWKVSEVDSFIDLNQMERKVIDSIYKSTHGLSTTELLNKLKVSYYQIRKALLSLQSKELVKSEGKSKNTRYYRVD